MLTGPQKVSVAEITQEEYATINTLAADLTEDQETSIIADLVTWALIRDSHVKLNGGKDGIDFDNARKREAIRQRIRKALSLSLISDEALALDPNAMSIFELDVGSNFG